MTALDVVRSISGLTSAMAAGALLVALFVILPLLLRQPVERYPATNAFVLSRMDKLMPVCTGIAVACGVLLAVALDHGPVQALFAAGAALLVGVIAVSVGLLGPINAAVRDIDPAHPRPDWPRLRERWRRWHLVRVGLGQAGAVLYAIALAVSA